MYLFFIIFDVFIFIKLNYDLYKLIMVGVKKISYMLILLVSNYLSFKKDIVKDI